MLAGVLPQDNGQIEARPSSADRLLPAKPLGSHRQKKQTLTAFDWLKKRREGVYDQDIRSILGKMLFSGDDAFKPISHLSGGETARLIIGGMMLCNYNVLILDEPNNHLDLEAVSALAWALEDYKGTVIVASHDRDLLNKSINKTVSLEENKIVKFDGNLEEYLSAKAT